MIIRKKQPREAHEHRRADGGHLDHFSLILHFSHSAISNMADVCEEFSLFSVFCGLPKIRVHSREFVVHFLKPFPPVFKPVERQAVRVMERMGAAIGHAAQQDDVVVAVELPRGILETCQFGGIFRRKAGFILQYILDTTPFAQILGHRHAE